MAYEWQITQISYRNERVRLEDASVNLLRRLYAAIYAIGLPSPMSDSHRVVLGDKVYEVRYVGVKAVDKRRLAG